MDRFSKALGRIETALAVVAGLLLLFITISICLSMALRALNLQTPLWSVQFNEYSLLWITFLGAAWLLRKGRHVSLDLLTRRLGRRGLLRLKAWQAFLGLAVCGLLAWMSGAVAWDHFQRGIMDVRAVDVPKHWILSLVFLGFVLLALEFLRDLLLNLKEIRSRT